MCNEGRFSSSIPRRSKEAEFLLHLELFFSSYSQFFPGGLLMKPEGSSVLGATSPLVLGATSPLVLSSEENARLQSQLEGAKKASSPSHRPTVNTSFDRRRTQMMGGQFKAKKAVPKPIW